jgi:hypothetical protein
MTKSYEDRSIIISLNVVHCATEQVGNLGQVRTRRSLSVTHSIFTIANKAQT